MKALLDKHVDTLKLCQNDTRKQTMDPPPPLLSATCHRHHRCSHLHYLRCHQTSLRRTTLMIIQLLRLANAPWTSPSPLLLSRRCAFRRSHSLYRRSHANCPRRPTLRGFQLFRLFSRHQIYGFPNYITSKVELLLEILGSILPLGKEEWAVVLKQLNDEPDELAVSREQYSLRKKF